MLRRSQQFYLQVLQVSDALLLCAALWLAHLFRIDILTEVPGIQAKEIAPFENYFWLMMIILPLGPLLLEYLGIYRLTTPRSVLDSLSSISKAVGLLLVLLTMFLFIFKVPGELISRGVFLLYWPIASVLILLRQQLFQHWLDERGRSALTRNHMLLVGRPEDCARWMERLKADKTHNFYITTGIDLRVTPLTEFIDLLHRESIDVVLFDLDDDVIQPIRQAIQACESEGIEAWLTTDLFRTTIAKPKFDEFIGLPLLVYRSTPDASWQILAKAIIDRILSLILLIVLSPLLLSVILLLAVINGRPIFFMQKRSGRYGRPFLMYKLRTMISNAEQKKVELQMLNAMTGPVFKIEGDPRITPLGCWLRRYSIDEIPQLWNVLKGEMSLVGPRPLPVYETENFSDFSQRRRMSVSPGLTCLWQVAGRNEITDFKDWVRLDLEYIDTWSLWLDFKILLRTIPAVLWGRGAK